MKKFYISGFEKEFSAIGMGTMIFGPEIKEKCFDLLNAFVQQGGTYIDTAEVYGSVEELGLAEIVLGEWLSQSPGMRDRIILCSKGLIPGYCKELHGEKGGQITPENISKAISGSLERLKSDYLDIWMFHRDDTSVPVGPLIDTLHDEVVAGRIKAFGASNWSVERIQEANDYSALNGKTKIFASSPNFSLAVPKESFWPNTVSVDESDKVWFIENNFPLVAWSSLGRGFFNIADINDKSNEDLVRTYYNPDNFERKRRAELLSKSKGLSMFQVALAYVLNQPFPVVALNGAETVDQVISSSQASDIDLSLAECNWIDLSSEEVPESVLNYSEKNN